MQAGRYIDYAGVPQAQYRASGYSQASSVFSNEDTEYDKKIKEIEEHYLKTLSTQQVSSEEEDNVSDISSDYEVLNYAGKLPVGGGNSAGCYNGSGLKDGQVALNEYYHPSSATLPLTLENLERLSSKTTLIENPTVMDETLAVTDDNVCETPSKFAATQINKKLFKTELCQPFSRKGFCKYGSKCQFAHGLQELKTKRTSTNYRTKPCLNWTKLGSCPYGNRCLFKHGDDRDIEIYKLSGNLILNNSESADSNSTIKNLNPKVKQLQGLVW